jgi:radical SAM superfamily enzyme YgiQ (UPF0313 family)
MRVLLVVYDNGSYIHYFPQGIAYIASAIRNVGHKVVIYNQDVHHYPSEYLTQYLNEQEYFDVVGVGVIGGYYQYRKLLEISEAINKSKKRPNTFVLGGHGPSPEPEFFLKKTQADIVVMGEGEETIVELLSGDYFLADIPGIAYRVGDSVIVNERRSLIKNIDNISWPAYDLFPMEHYRLMQVPGGAGNEFTMQMTSGRGCKFHCGFCFRLDKGFRPRSITNIIEEMLFLKEKYNIKHVSFLDELTMSSVERMNEFSSALLEKKVNMKWDCNGRLNFAAKDKKMLQLMKEAGCTFINYGVEAMSDEVLKNMNKGLRVKQIIEGVENTLSVGISPGLNIMFGNIGDSEETIKKDVDFLLKYDDHVQLRTIRPMTPYPGSPLYYQAIKRGLLKGVEDFYENKHLNSDLLTVNFTNMTDKEFYDNLSWANMILTEKYFENKKEKYKEQIEKLYKEQDASFRGFRQS